MTNIVVIDKRNPSKEDLIFPKEFARRMGELRKEEEKLLGIAIDRDTGRMNKIVERELD